MKSASPKKSRPSTAVQQAVTQKVVSTYNNYSDKFFELKENAELQIELMKAKDEIYKLETNLIAVSQKIAVQNDLRADANQHKEMFDNSERLRGQLQEQISQMTERHDGQVKTNQEQYQELILINQKHEEKHEADKQEAVRIEQSHHENVTALHKEHEAVKQKNEAERKGMVDSMQGARSLYEKQKDKVNAEHNQAIKHRDDTLAQREAEHTKKVNDNNLEHSNAIKKERDESAAKL